MGLNRAYLEALLEGAPLPATKRDLIRHVRHDGARDRGDAREAISTLRHLPSRRYSSLDEVGEALMPVQPKRTPADRLPRSESDREREPDRRPSRSRPG